MAPIRCCFDQTAVWHSDAARGPSTPSFDHLVGKGEQRARNGNVERSGSVEVNDEIEFGWLLDRDVGRFRSTQNLIDVIGGTPKQVRIVCSEGHQPSPFDILPSPVHGRQPRADGQDIDWNSVATHETVNTDIKRLAAALNSIEGGSDVECAPGLQGVVFGTERDGCSLNLRQHQYGERLADIAQDRETAQARNNLAQELDSLAGKLIRLDR